MSNDTQRLAEIREALADAKRRGATTLRLGLHQVDSLFFAIDQARADTALLDWLEKLLKTANCWYSHLTKLYVINNSPTNSTAPTLREAARKAKEGK